MPTLEELHSVPGKAEIVDGRLERVSPTGLGPGRAALRIAASLYEYEEEHGGGAAFGDNVGFIVRLPHRDSFSPDAAWHIGPVDESNMEFVVGAPVFAVEVRSKNDYGPKAERAIAAKIADYFAAGTLVVWDVDILSDAVITSHCAEASGTPLVFRRGERAHAEPAVPGWTFPLSGL